MQGILTLGAGVWVIWNAKTYYVERLLLPKLCLVFWLCRTIVDTFCHKSSQNNPESLELDVSLLISKCMEVAWVITWEATLKILNVKLMSICAQHIGESFLFAETEFFIKLDKVSLESWGHYITGLDQFPFSLTRENWSFHAHQHKMLCQKL